MKTDGPHLESRRRFLTRVIYVISGAIGTALAIPVIVSTVLNPILASRKKAEAQWTELGNTADFKPGAPTLIRWNEEAKDGWVSTLLYRAVWVYNDNGNYKVWNPKCTHLGCLTYYNDQTNTIDSPCHAGIFGLPDGRVVSGPPPRPLDLLQSKVQDNKVYCIYQDFRLGITQQQQI